jgi:hypothetical protein
MTDGASSVAVPVRGANGAVIAAVSVVVPTGQRDLVALVPAVRIAAAGISRAMVPFTSHPETERGDVMDFRDPTPIGEQPCAHRWGSSERVLPG